MKLVEIPKRNGGTRTICVPSPQHKRKLRALIPGLQRIVRKVCDMSVVHGFAELRSPVTNAARHVGYRYTLSFDLADFFDTVKEAKLPQGSPLRKYDYRRCWHGGVARQGLPTSPILANIAAAEMDKKIQEKLLLASRGTGIVYTRYADDLAFSFSERGTTTGPMIAEWISRIVHLVVGTHGFKINPKKTTLQDSRRGRRIITGIAVDDTGMYPTRKAKRKLRAALHNAKTGKVKHFPRRQWTRYLKVCKHRGRKPMPKGTWLRRWLWKRVRGLEEWLALKPPAVGSRSAKRIGAAYEASEALCELAARSQA